MTPILNDFQKLSLCGDLSFSKHIMFVNGKEEKVRKLLSQNVWLARGDGGCTDVSGGPRGGGCTDIGINCLLSGRWGTGGRAGITMDSRPR